MLAQIRVLGGLLSAHILAEGSMPGFAHMRVAGYRGALLRLARDLGERLLPAFEQAPQSTGLPYAFVHLQRGVVAQPVAEQCTAGIGTTIMEFAVLSNLTADERFARASLGALGRLWAYRSEHELLGNTIDIHTGKWLNSFASIGAGADSFYEYLAKGALMLDSKPLQAMFDAAYTAVGMHLQQGAHFAHADMNNPAGRRQQVHGALQAFWPALQCLVGDAEQAVPTHEAIMAAWDKYGLMPEQYSVSKVSGEVSAGHVPYPLRPEVRAAACACSPRGALGHGGAGVNRPAAREPREKRASGPRVMSARRLRHICHPRCINRPQNRPSRSTARPATTRTCILARVW